MRVILLALVVTAPLVSSTAFAQGAFVARGASGILIGGDYLPDEGRKSYSAEVGYSFGGTFDVGLAYSWLESPADTFSFQLDGRAVEPRVTLHLAKQGSTYPFSLSAYGSYGFRTLDAMPSSGAEAEVDGRMLRVGGYVHSIVQLAEFIGVRPWGGIMYVRRASEYTFADPASTLKITADGTEYMFGAQLVFMPTVWSVLYVGPQVRYLSGDRTVGFSAGLIFN